MKTKKIALPLVLLAASALSAHAATIFATEDTYVRRGDTNGTGGSGDNVRNFDGDDDGSGNERLRVKYSSDNSNANRITYLGFSTATITNTVSSATLDLSVILTADRVIRVYGIPDADATNTDEFFAASSLTFNSADSLIFNDASSPQNNVDTAENLVDLGTFNALGDVSSGKISFTSAALIAFLNDDTNSRVSFILASETQNTGDSPEFFASEQAGTDFDPQINFTQVPEPSTLVLFSLSGLALFRRRRNFRIPG